jgi:hypothetical protein
MPVAIIFFDKDGSHNIWYTMPLSHHFSIVCLTEGLHSGKKSKVIFCRKTSIQSQQTLRMGKVVPAGGGGTRKQPWQPKRPGLRHHYMFWINA